MRTITGRETSSRRKEVKNRVASSDRFGREERGSLDWSGGIEGEEG
jgi:hypothetical protein